MITKRFKNVLAQDVLTSENGVLISKFLDIVNKTITLYFKTLDATFVLLLQINFKVKKFLIKACCIKTKKRNANEKFNETLKNIYSNNFNVKCKLKV